MILLAPTHGPIEGGAGMDTFLHGKATPSSKKKKVAKAKSNKLNSEVRET